MKNVYLSSALVVSGLLVPIVSGLEAASVSTPYFNDFSSSVADFTETTDSNWSLQSGTYQYLTTAQLTDGSAMLTANAFGSTYQDFVVSTTFTVTSNLSSGTSNWVMALLGDSETPSDFLLVDYSSAGTFRVINLGGEGNGTLVNTSGSLGGFNIGDSISLTATGTYSGSNLVMTVDIANITDGTSNTIATSAFDVSTHYQGSAMGLRARSGSDSGGTPGTTVQYDSFSIAAVPEPGVFALLAGASMLGFVMLRRRR